MRNKNIKPIPLGDVMEEYYQKYPKERGSIEAQSEALRFKIQLREARKLSNLSQAELAKKSGVGQDKISRMEKGQQNFTIGTLQKIATALGKTVKIELE